MRLVHLADIHLGFRQYQGQTPTGINQREADIAATLKRVVDKVIEIRPEIVLIAGDVFHAVRPTNHAILHGYRQLSRLVGALPDAAVVMVAGNHDTPRTSETACILKLFSPLGITVVEGEAKQLPFEQLELMVTAVPNLPGGRPTVAPDSAFKRNILLFHGEVDGVFPQFGQNQERSHLMLSRAELTAGWDYVALGHYHVFRKVEPYAFYPGSIDYTSTNPWGELVEERETGLAGKGIIEFDLESGTHKFHHIAAARALVDLPPILGSGMSAAALDEAIREACGGCKGGIDEKVVRLVVREVPRHILRELDHKALREFKRRALHFHLDARPETVRREAGQGAPGRRASLADTVRDKLRSRVITDNIDREGLVALGLHYLREADMLSAPVMEGDTA